MSRIIINYDNEEWAFELKQGSNVVGRSSRCSISIKDPNLSREHCEIVNNGEVCVVYDKGSRNGTVVNGEKIIEKRLKESDKIEIGGTTIYFEKKPLEIVGDRPARIVVSEPKNVVVVEEIKAKAVAQPTGEDFSYWAKGGNSVILKTIVVLIIVGVVAVAAVFFLSRSDNRVGNINLLANGEFEDIGSGGVPVGWQVVKPDYFAASVPETSSVIKTDNVTLKSGKYSLLLDKSSSSKDFLVECAYSDFLSVKRSRALDVSLWVKSESPNILIAVKAVWYADKKGLPLFEEVSKPMKVSDWTQIRHKFDNRGYTAYCKLSLVAIGRGGRVYFDDVRVQGQTDRVAFDKGLKGLGDYQVSFSNSCFYVVLKNSVVISNARLLLISKDGISPQVILNDITYDDGVLKLKGAVIDPATMNELSYECELTYKDNSLHITYLFNRQEIRQVDGIVLLFNLPKVDDVKIYPAQSGPVSQLSFKQGDIEMALEYMPQMTVNTTRVGSDEGVASSLELFSRSASSDDKSIAQFSCGFTLSESVLSRITSVEESLKLAEADMRIGKYGETYIIYKKLMQHIKDNEMLSDVSKKIDNIKLLARTEWERIEGKVIEAKLSRSLEKCGEARDAIQRYIGCFVESDLISVDAEQAYIEIVKLSEELGDYNPADGNLDNLIKMAQYYKSSGKNVLASTICELIIRKYAGTFAEDEARQILAEIRK